MIGEIGAIDLENEFRPFFSQKFIDDGFDFVLAETTTGATRVGPTEVHVLNNLRDAGLVGCTRTSIFEKCFNCVVDVIVSISVNGVLSIISEDT